jgi:hypothetical protein
MYIYVYVPFAGRIAPATALNRVGPLPARFPTAGGPVRARAGCLQRRGASCPSGTSAVRAAGRWQDRTFPA